MPSTTTDAAVNDAAPEQAPEGTFWNKIGYWFPHILILAYCGTIAGAFSTQFIGNEFPCPLCMLQRMAMILASIGALWIIGQARKGTLTMSSYMMSYGLTILAAMFGMAMSGRQILLHILPGDPGYGGTVLGLHLYTWAFITFVVVLLYAALMMIFSKSTFPIAPKGNAAKWITFIVIGIFIFIIAANAVSVFFEEGLHWYLPDDPTRYELLNS